MRLLIRFIYNFFVIHTHEADHLIIYLCDHKWLSLVMDGNTRISDESIKVFEESSDISYSDDYIMCRSFKEYIFWLFDCSVDWCAIRQNTVTISTIEIELLALTHTGK